MCVVVCPSEYIGYVRVESLIKSFYDGSQAVRNMLLSVGQTGWIRQLTDRQGFIRLVPMMLKYSPGKQSIVMRTICIKNTAPL